MLRTSLRTSLRAALPGALAFLAVLAGCAPSPSSSSGGGHGSGDELGRAGFSLAGGTHDFGPVAVRAPQGAAKDQIAVVARKASLPAPLPSGAPLLAAPVAIELAQGRDALELPLELTFSYPATPLTEQQVPFVARFEPELGRWEPTSLLGFDRQRRTVRIDSRAEGVFAPVVLDLGEPSGPGPTAGYRVPEFDVGRHGWSIANFEQRYLTPGGNCLGMTGFARFMRAKHSSLALHDTFRDSSAEIVAIRAHMAVSQVWGQFLIARSRILDVFGGSFRASGLLMKRIMSTFEAPVIALLSAGKGRGGHAGLVFGWDDSGFLFYDVNLPRRVRTLPFTDGDGFGTYEQYHEFGYVALSTVGSYAQFEGIYQEARGGFRSDKVAITEPQAGVRIAEASVLVKGTVAEASWDTAVLFVNGIQWHAPIAGGKFEQRVPLRNGGNSIIVLAGRAMGQRSLFARDSGVQQISVQSTVRKAAFKASLSWDQDNADVDLYAYEPGGEVAWFRNKRTASGGELDIDNTRGFGPEHYATGPGTATGRLRIRVHYYSDKGTGQRASGRVNLLLHEGTQNQRFEIVPFSIATSDRGNADPGDRGSDWADIGTVDLDNGSISQ